jgi:hypothetical protein
MPIDVSTLRPAFTAVTDAPLPMWATTAFKDPFGFTKNPSASRQASSTEIP